jgi:hypothetical protein
MTDEISVGELTRQVASVLLRFEHLATRLDESYVAKQFFELYRENLNRTIGELAKDIETAARKESLQDKVDRSDFTPLKSRVDDLDRRVKKLEDNLGWIVKIVLTFVVLTVLGAVFVASGLQK